MKLEKYMATYRNDNLVITDEDVIGTLEDVKEYFKYLLASQCMGFNTDYEILIHNAKMIIYFLEDAEESGLDNKMKVRVFINPMGAICIDKEYND